MLRHMYFSSLVKGKRLRQKIEFWMVWLTCGGHVGVPKLYTNMASTNKALRFAELNFSAHNSNCVSQRLVIRFWGSFSVIVFNDISFSWLLSLNGSQFIFWWHYSAYPAMNKKTLPYVRIIVAFLRNHYYYSHCNSAKFLPQWPKILKKIFPLGSIPPVPRFCLIF